VKRESVLYLVSGTLFGLLIGWILGSQQGAPVTVAAAPSSAAAPQGANPQAPPPLDEARVADLQKQANADPANVKVRVEIGNAYFDAERFAQAIPFYEAAFKLDAKNVDVSTDLGVAYYYDNQVDKALKQFDASLALNPKHPKTLLNVGIVLAFGKQDLKGAEAAWEKVVAAAPGTEEAQKAQQGLDGLRSAHNAKTPAGQPKGRGGTP
jgi:tetratricopeptide (TPR) repeat protein